MSGFEPHPWAASSTHSLPAGIGIGSLLRLEVQPCHTSSHFPFHDLSRVRNTVDLAPWLPLMLVTIIVVYHQDQADSLLP